MSGKTAKPTFNPVMCQYCLFYILLLQKHTFRTDKINKAIQSVKTC